MKPRQGIVIALGGNAISKPGLRGTIQEQFYATRESMDHVATLIAKKIGPLVITHGNGPQIGAAILRSEIASTSVYPLPMDICVADIQGGMGYMIGQVLTNCLRRRKLKRTISTLITQVEVDPHDPAFEKPTKPIGLFYSAKEAKALMAARNWVMREDAGRGWRRVVPSPKPQHILESSVIQELFHNDHVVITGGGGGIPVAKNRHGLYYGIEAVIDKDLTSAKLATSINAETLIILTGVKNVYLHYHTPREKALKTIRAKELADHLQQGHFPDGSMRPKVEACLQFLKEGGKRAIITSMSQVLGAIKGKKGTQVVP